MIESVILLLLWVSAIGCALMAGIYFAFSAFIMRALGEIDRAAGIAAMNAINRVILRSLFLPIFFGSTLTSLALAIISLLSWGRTGSMAMLAGGVVYVSGMFVVTIARNVPLNDRLAAAQDADTDTWANYLSDWTRWNHVRTAASVAGLVLFVLAIDQR